MGDLLYQYENIEFSDGGFYAASDHGIQEPVSFLLLVYSDVKTDIGYFLCCCCCIVLSGSMFFLI